MKKILPVILILAIVGVGGYFYLSSRGLGPKTPLKLGNKSSKGVFNSIQEALTKSISLKCVYKNEEGVETTTYIKGGTVRVMMTSDKSNDQPNNIVMKDKKMYMWNDSTKTGFVFEVENPSTSPMPTFKVEKGLEPEKQPDIKQQESILAQIEKYKDACKVETIADSMFSIPTDVKFQDMSTLQKQMMKGLPQVPQGDNQEDVQKYIQEMMQQQGENQ